MFVDYRCYKYKLGKVLNILNMWQKSGLIQLKAWFIKNMFNYFTLNILIILYY